MSMFDAERKIGSEKIKSTFSDKDNVYSIEINGLLEDFLHHSFDNPIMPPFKGMACRNLVNGIEADTMQADFGDPYTRHIQSSVSATYETDSQGRVVKMTVTKESKAVEPPDGIDEETYTDIPGFNYTEVFEFSY